MSHRSSLLLRTSRGGPLLGNHHSPPFRRRCWTWRRRCLGLILSGFSVTGSKWVESWWPPSDELVVAVGWVPSEVGASLWWWIRLVSSALFTTKLICDPHRQGGHLCRLKWGIVTGILDGSRDRILILFFLKRSHCCRGGRYLVGP